MKLNNALTDATAPEELRRRLARARIAASLTQTDYLSWARETGRGWI